MAYRTSGKFTVASSTIPQPLFGSWVTAVSPATGFQQAASAPLVLTLGTAQAAGNDASQIFQQGEPAWLVDPSGSNKGGVHGETVTIAAISGNTLTLGPKTSQPANGQIAAPFTEYPHVAGVVGTGSWIIPKQLLNNFLVQYETGGTGSYLYLGNSMLMTATLWRFFEMAAQASGQPSFYTASMTSPGNPYDLSELWVFGTAGDSWTASINVD